MTPTTKLRGRPHRRALIAIAAAPHPRRGGPPEVDGGAPHVADGMFAELVVTG